LVRSKLPEQLDSISVGNHIQDHEVEAPGKHCCFGSCFIT
jgi:hypothetical protein